jgi:nicotinamidase-related amidase
MAGFLAFGPLPKATAHLCVDMQNVFLEETEWHVPWMKIILPAVTELAGRRSERTVFTRFRPLPDVQPIGSWRRYYERWPQYTVDAATGLLDLVAPLAVLSPPAITVDKGVYSAFACPLLRRWLRHHRIECLVISGVETDVCVLATILSAIDQGYRVVVPLDAVCSSTDQGHDSLIDQYRRRFSQQLETSDVQTILACWLASDAVG